MLPLSDGNIALGNSANRSVYILDPQTRQTVQCNIGHDFKEMLLLSDGNIALGHPGSRTVRIVCLLTHQHREIRNAARLIAQGHRTSDPNCFFSRIPRALGIKIAAMLGECKSEDPIKLATRYFGKP